MKTNRNRTIQRMLLTAFLFMFCIVTNAQEKTDRVEMKSGSIIYGTVIEQNFSEKRIKIQTTEGSILVFNLSDVKEIIKAQEVLNDTLSKENDYSYWVEEKPLEYDSYNNKGNGLHKDIRTIFDVGYGFGLDYGDNKEDRTATNLAIGYQFNPHIFLGGGIGFHSFDKNQIIALPLFINFRTDFVNKVVTPFFDIKIGYSPLGKFDKAGYASLGLGVRFWHLNISIASDALAQSIGSNGYTYSNDYGYIIDDDTEILTFSNFFIRFGVDL